MNCSQVSSRFLSDAGRNRCCKRKEHTEHTHEIKRRQVKRPGFVVGIYEPQRPFRPFLPGIESRPNIYILTLDSTSRMSLQRHAPLTFKTLQRFGYTWFHRFNTLSPGGTRSTLFPLMHGGIPVNNSDPFCGSSRQDSFARNLHWEEIALRCTPEHRRLMHRLKHQFGYRTGLAEMMMARQYLVLDEIDNRLPWFPLYNYKYHGKKAEDEPVNPDLNCVGNQLGYLSVLDFVEQFFLSARPNEPPGFLYAHLSGSHDSPKGLRFIDGRLAEHILLMARQPNTAVIVMADHGRPDHTCDYQRPMLAIRISPSLQRDLAVLKRNTDKLVTPWDIYTTVRDLASAGTEGFGADEISGDELISMPFARHDVPYVIRKAHFTPSSLLRPVPERSCEEAGILKGHCAVQKISYDAWVCGDIFDFEYFTIKEFRDAVDADVYERVHTTGEPGLTAFCENMANAAQWLLDDINFFLEGADPEKRCARFSLWNVELIELDKSAALYSLQIVTREGNPKRVFLARFADVGTADLNSVQDGVRTMSLHSYRQLTRFKRYEACTPARVNPEVCVCSTTSELES